MGLAQISLVVVHQPVLTGPIEDQLGPATGPTISLNWSSIQKNTMLHSDQQGFRNPCVYTGKG